MKRELPEGFLLPSRQIWLEQRSSNMRSVFTMSAQELHDAIAWTAEFLDSPNGVLPDVRARLLLDIECLTDLLDRKLNS
jgi:hypothetical protein